LQFCVNNPPDLKVNFADWFIVNFIYHIHHPCFVFRSGPLRTVVCIQQRTECSQAGSLTAVYC
jgi:hypothetical protein